MGSALTVDIFISVDGWAGSDGRTTGILRLSRPRARGIDHDRSEMNRSA
jgi:hypothetical protein